MNNKDTGGPAFPCEESTDFLVECKCGETVTFNDVAHPGMTLRDWFAGQALAGYRSPSDHNPEDVARRCFSIADAMLKERSE